MQQRTTERKHRARHTSPTFRRGWVVATYIDGVDVEVRPYAMNLNAYVAAEGVGGIINRRRHLCVRGLPDAKQATTDCAYNDVVTTGQWNGTDG